MTESETISPPVTNTAVDVTAPSVSVRVWSPLVVAIYALLLGFPSSLVLAIKNWRALRMYREAKLHLLGGIILALPVITLFLLASRRTAKFVSLVVNVVAFVYVKAKLQADIDEATAKWGAESIQYRRWYSAFPWAVLGLLLLIVVFVPLFVALAFAGVIDID